MIRRTLAVAFIFPLIVILGGVVGFIASDTVHQFASWTNPLLGLVMFTMGLTLNGSDFYLILTRPLPVLIGVVAQFVIMPLSAVFVAWVLQLPPELAAGVILVGCAPGGTASNVVSYLARGDVALSVTMSAVSTLLAPILTPLLTWWLAGSYMPVSAGSMAMSILQIVFLPVVAGVVVHRLAGRIVAWLTPALPAISVVAITIIVAIVVSGSQDVLLTAGGLVFIAVILHNLLGYGLGYVAGIITGQPLRVRRTIAIEVGMQNSGLAAGLAAQYLSPLAALAGAVFSVWHNISGSLLAAGFRVADARRAARGGVDKSAMEAVN